MREGLRSTGFGVGCIAAKTRQLVLTRRISDQWNCNRHPSDAGLPIGILNSVIEHHSGRARMPAYKSSAIAMTATMQIKKLKTFISPLQ
jgi:hypothetical protein